MPEDASEALWGAYFANIFNPARVKIKAMKREMPLRYWPNLPETNLIPQMLANAEARVAAMRAAAPTEPTLMALKVLERLAPAPAPAEPATLEEARRAAMGCTACALCEGATQTVWGAGDPSARLMLEHYPPFRIYTAEVIWHSRSVV